MTAVSLLCPQCSLFLQTLLSPYLYSNCYLRCRHGTRRCVFRGIRRNCVPATTVVSVVVPVAMLSPPDEPPHTFSWRSVPSVFAPTMARTHVILTGGLSSGRASAGSAGVPAARPESGPTEQLAGAFLFPNTGAADDRLGREAPLPGRVGALFATYLIIIFYGLCHYFIIYVDLWIRFFCFFLYILCFHFLTNNSAVWTTFAWLYFSSLINTPSFWFCIYNSHYCYCLFVTH